MTDEELIARLRGWARDIQEGSKAIWAMDQDLKEAAARIEALLEDRDGWIKNAWFAREKWLEFETLHETAEAAAYAQGYGDCEAEISLTEIGRTNGFLHGQIAKWKAHAEQLAATNERLEAALEGLLEEALALIQNEKGTTND